MTHNTPCEEGSLAARALNAGQWGFLLARRVIARGDLIGALAMSIIVLASLPKPAEARPDSLDTCTDLDKGHGRARPRGSGAQTHRQWSLREARTGGLARMIREPRIGTNGKREHV